MGILNLGYNSIKSLRRDILRNKIDLRYFWVTFEQVLNETGNPFGIIHEKSGEQTYWACVNKNKILTDNVVDISLVQSKNFLRIGLYIIDRTTDIGKIILANKEQINESLSFNPIWEDGTKNKNTLRVIIKLPIDNFTPRELIYKALPYVMEFISVAKKYGEKEFFDF